jgi:hypothetical protein
MQNAGGPIGLEAYQVLPFSLRTSNPEIKDSYLFLHKLEYQWDFVLTPEGWAGSEGEIQLQPKSLGPSVVHYFDRSGSGRVSVRPLYFNESGKEVTANQPLSISASPDFRWYNILAGAEIAAWLIAAIVAIATGLLIYYYKGTSWGTWQDYLTLFIWGVGVDQGKNFLQYLGAFSGQPVNPSSASH